MGLKQLITCILLNFTSLILYAQDSVPEIVYDQENEYIHTYKNRITGRLFYVNTSNPLTINDRHSDEKFELTPNKQNRIGASVAFRSLAISYSFAPDFIAENKDNDDSELFNLNLRTYFGEHWMQTVDVYSQSGFYLSNNDVNVYLPNTKSLKIGGATSYIMNKNFSFRAIASQDEKQLKSAGSFIPRVIYYYTYYHLRASNENSADTVDTRSRSYDIAFAPSYFYNFVPTKNLFLSAGVSAGIGLNYSKDQDENLTSILTEFNFRGSATYDIDNLYLGAHYSYLILNHNSDRSSYINDNIPYFQIFVGYRFKAPSKLVNKADDFNKKLKI